MAGACVYVISCEDGKCKIGFSETPRERVSQLQIGNGAKLRLEYASEPLKNAPSCESITHMKLHAYQEQSEWFDCPIEVAINAVKKVVRTSGKPYDASAYEDNIAGKVNAYFASKVAKLEAESAVIKLENQRIQDLTWDILLKQDESDYINCIYKVLFDMNARQLRKKYGVTEKESLRDCFSETENKMILSMLNLVSGLVDCGWGYDQVKEFITTTNMRRLTG